MASETDKNVKLNRKKFLSIPKRNYLGYTLVGLNAFLGKLCILIGITPQSLQVPNMALIRPLDPQAIAILGIFLFTSALY